MKNIKNSDALYSEADYMLAAADLEMQRSSEDVVTHTICYKSRQSITNYLRGYLLHMGIEPQAPFSMEHLRKQCLAIDNHFEGLDLSVLPCREEEGHASYCLSVDKVAECLQVANEVRDMVRHNK